jgi:hypothetical protein
VSVADPLAWLTAEAQKWIRAQRDSHRPLALPLPEVAAAALEPFFGLRALGRARFRTVPVIEDAPFIAQAVALGIPKTMDFAEMAGITFDDTILLSLARPVPNYAALVFHELVHVVQYEILGVDEFARRYVGGFVAGGFDYYAIPLERMAYELQVRFETQVPGAPFSARDEIVRILRDGGQP